MKLNSIRARMTRAFALSLAALMLLVCSGLVWYARYTAERNAETLLKMAARKVLNDLAEDEKEHHHLSEFVKEKSEELQADGLIAILMDAGGRIVQKPQGDIPAWPRTNRRWRIATVSYGSNTIVLGLPWEKMENTLRMQGSQHFFRETSR